MKSRLDRDGYSLIGLYVDGKPKTFKLHRLILEAFVGPCPEGMEGCHNDGNPGNNGISNLRWDYPRKNQADRVTHGTNLRGEKHPIAKLTHEQVNEILSRDYSQWGSKQATAKEYGVSPATISVIIHGKRWRHLS